MSSKYPRYPVSGELCERIREHLERKGTFKERGVLEIRKGTRANEMIFVTVEGEVPCRIMEDDIFIIFEMPSGENDLCAPTREFLEVLSRSVTPKGHPNNEEVPAGN